MMILRKIPGLLILLTVAACNRGEEARPVPAAGLPTALPTPTLASGLPTAPPLTLPEAETAVSPAASSIPVPTMTPIPTVTPLPSPTPSPLPAERLDLALASLHDGDFPRAIALLEASVQQPDAFTPAQQTENLYWLGVAYLREERPSEAAATLEQLLAQAATAVPSPAHFFLGQAYQALGDAAAAIAAYEAYLAAEPDLGAYVYPLMAEAYGALGEGANAQAALETAVTTPAHRLTEIGNRRRLAQAYMEAGDYPAAVAQYDAIRDLAQTELTRGEMAYWAGTAELAAGNTEAAYGRFQAALTAYPRAYETYLGLVQLVEAGQPVDEFQRGLVNYYAKSYEPAAAAFARYFQANPETADPEAHLYAAWSYEGLGDLPAALAQLEAYASSNPAVAAIERGKLLARAGDAAGALENYQFYRQNYPDGESAPFAAWWSAAIAERQGDVATAVTRYTDMADTYSWHEDAPEALFRAGWLAYQSGDTDTAVILWNRVAQNYPANEFGSAGLVWLLRLLPDYAPATHDEDGGGVPDPHKMLALAHSQAVSLTAVNYYALRARDIVAERPPFASQVPFRLPPAEEEAAAQAEAEAWLRTWLALAPEADVRSLAPVIREDARLVRGEKLWQLGLHEAAKRELEAVREEYGDDALSSYQLALYFRGLGLYRSSILAAARLPALAGQTIFEVPPFIGRLIYPVYYADIVLALADRHGYDPRLQFALLRQESLYESFATSSAVAQGLSQVIPDTGAYIAQQLNWPEYENEDLYRPVVGLNFGAYYLDQQLDTFNGDVHAALSAYNAGPGNAARWYEAAGGDLDIYLEAVNFAETRLYIERIYEGYVIYRHLYGDSEF